MCRVHWRGFFKKDSNFINTKMILRIIIFYYYKESNINIMRKCIVYFLLFYCGFIVQNFYFDP